MAPPRKLDDDLIEAWCEAISVGLTPRLVCGKLGISTTIWDKWKAKGDADIEAGIDSLEARLVGRHARAKAERNGNWLTGLNMQAQSDPSSLRWLLEHCAPDDYGKNRIELTGKDGGPVAVAQTVVVLPAKMSVDEWVASVNATLGKRDE